MIAVISGSNQARLLSKEGHEEYAALGTLSAGSKLPGHGDHCRGSAGIIVGAVVNPVSGPRIPDTYMIIMGADNDVGVAQLHAGSAEQTNYVAHSGRTSIGLDASHDMSFGCSRRQFVEKLTN